MAPENLLEVRDLAVEFKARGRRGAVVKAVDGVSFTVKRGETVGLVGESGSGKSTIGRAVLGLTRPARGSVHLDGRDITGYRAGADSSIAKRLQVVFQDPFSSLNPSRTIGRTLTEPLEIQGNLAATEAINQIQRLLDSVGLPKDAATRYPHGFSGGQRQRIAIARSLATSPELVICDEAVSALDLVTRAQVLNLLARLQRETGQAFLFIAHDIPIVTHVSQRTVVLYRGRVMEQGPARSVHERPLHPYTRALLAAVPVPDPVAQRERRAARRQLVAATTAEAKPIPEQGCPFAPRCVSASDVCWSKRPADTAVQDVTLACHLYDPASGHPDATTPYGGQKAAIPGQQC
ncbi:MAG: ATP-binding cassette domain-containing protein [Nocardioides sp.]|uniref:oligopeptide/dipeptide ABC transporter ATP-binding protein n=1 Tax=Nocardioides sp. TaxID=35761 RepID=UPI0039E5D241